MLSVGVHHGIVNLNLYRLPAAVSDIKPIGYILLNSDFDIPLKLWVSVGR
jgi:hypothetical protein